MVSTSLPIDCAICMGTIENAACGRCMHHFCYECLLSAARVARQEGNSSNCPVCRVPLDFISKDRQYDEMVRVVAAALKQAADQSTEPKQVPDDKKAELMEIDFSVGEKSAGVCVQTVQGPGVRISKVLKTGRFYEAGFRPDDLVLDLNGTCCNDVESAVAVINSEQKKRGVLKVRVLRQHEHGGPKVTFRELELPRKVPPGESGKDLANNEHQADPGVWLEC